MSLKCRVNIKAHTIRDIYTGKRRRAILKRHSNNTRTVPYFIRACNDGPLLSCVVSKFPFKRRQVFLGESLPAGSTLTSVNLRKLLSPLAEPTALAHALNVFLDRADPAEWAKVFIWRNVVPAGRVTLPSKKADPPSSSRANVLFLM